MELTMEPLDLKDMDNQGVQSYEEELGIDVHEFQNSHPPPCSSNRHQRLISTSSSSTTNTNVTGKSLSLHRTSNSSQPTSYLQNIPGINMTLPANDPSVKTIKQHYYPEGGWGWVVVSLASFVHFITSAISSPAMSLIILEILNTFTPEYGVVGGVLAACFSTSLTLFASPFVMALCRRKSPRLMGILGGLVASLGCLFVSFATQFHQLFFAFGIFVGIGIAMIRDPSVVMVGQYFKKKRAFVEIGLMSCYSLGISFMPLVIILCIRSKSWRFGFQIMALVVSLCFFLGVLYRPASLYHPQRRAILHLKSLQKKSRLKDQHLKNAMNTAPTQVQSEGGGGSTVTAGVMSTSKTTQKIPSEKPAYFDFTVLKSKTVQIIMSGTCIAHFGMTAPPFLLAIQGRMDRLDYASLMRIQIFLGLGMVLGILVFGLIVVKNSSQCFISRQYLCQTSCLMLSIITLAFSSGLTDYSGYVLFAWMYGFFFGGYSYSLKMFVFEKVRARNFNRAWGFLQFSQSLPSFFGIPITIYLNEHLESKAGFYLSSVCLALGSAVFILIDAHKNSKKSSNNNRISTPIPGAAGGIERGITSGLLGCSNVLNGNSPSPALKEENMEDASPLP